MGWVGTLSQSRLKLCPLTPNTRGKWTHLLIYLFPFCSFIPKNNVFVGGHTGEYWLHNLHFHPSPGIHMYEKKYFEKYYYIWQKMTSKPVLTLKRFHWTKNKQQEYFAVNMNDRQTTTEMIQVHWIQIDLKWTR